MEEIKVLVPEARVAAFYRWFGAWLDDSDPQEEMGLAVEKAHWTNTPRDKELAAELWEKLSARARAMFHQLIGQPGVHFSGEELAAAAEIPNGRYGVAGVLAWPGRYCMAMNRHLPIRWSEQDGAYWMEPEVAQMFAEVAPG